MKPQHIGSDFDDFLKQEGLLAECEAAARERVAARRERRVANQLIVTDREDKVNPAAH